MQIKAWWLLVAFVAGGLVVGGIVLGVTSGASARLQLRLDYALSAMGDAIASSGRLAASNRQLQSDLATASERAASAERIVNRQQSIIADQQRDIDAGRRGLADLATGLASGLGDLRSRAEAIREIVIRLYGIYHPSPG